MFNDDRKIIQGLLDHDQAALDCLLKRHAGAIRACLLRRFPGVNTSDVDEAITNAAYRIWTQAHKFNEEIATLAAWFLIIADNCLRDIFRREQRQTTSQLPVGLLEQVAVSGAESDELPSELIADLYSVLPLLSRLQREVIENELATAPLTTRELADKLGTSLNVIYVTRNRARHRLSELLKERGH